MAYDNRRDSVPGGWMDPDTPKLSRNTNTQEGISCRRQSTFLDLEDEVDGSIEDLDHKDSKKYAPVIKRALKKLKSKKTSSGKETKIIQLVEEFETDELDLSEDSSASQSLSVGDTNIGMPTIGTKWGYKAGPPSPNPQKLDQVGDLPPPWPSVQGWLNVDTETPQVPKGDPLPDHVKKGKKTKSVKKKGSKLTVDNSEYSVTESGSKKSSKKKSIKKSKQIGSIGVADIKDETKRDIDLLMNCYESGRKLQAQERSGEEDNTSRDSESQTSRGRIMNMHSVGWDDHEVEYGDTAQDNILPSGLHNPGYHSKASSVKEDDEIEDTFSNSSGSVEYQIYRSKSVNVLDRGWGNGNVQNKLRSLRRRSVASDDSLARSWTTSSQDGKHSDDGREKKDKRSLLKRIFSRKKPPRPDKKRSDFESAVETVVAAKKWKRKLGIKSRQRSSSIISGRISLCPSENTDCPETEYKGDIQPKTKTDKTLMFQAQSTGGNSRRSSRTSQSMDVWSASPASSRRSSGSRSNDSAPKSVNTSPKPRKRRISWIGKRKKKEVINSGGVNCVSVENRHVVDQKSSKKGMFRAARVLLATAKWKKKSKGKHLVMPDETDEVQGTSPEPVYESEEENSDVKRSPLVNHNVDYLPKKWELDNLRGDSSDDWKDSSDEEEEEPLSMPRPKVILSKSTETTVFHDAIADSSPKPVLHTVLSIASLGAASDNLFGTEDIEKQFLSGQSLRRPQKTAVIKSGKTLKPELPTTGNMYEGSELDSDNEENLQKGNITAPGGAAVQLAFSRVSQALSGLNPDVTSDEDLAMCKSHQTVGRKSKCTDCLTPGTGHEGRRDSFLSTGDETDSDLLCQSCNGLQEELEAAKRKHLEEMEQKLECERSVAQQQLEREVARKRQEAEAELRRQQQEYEQRLAELEKALWDQKAEHQETEQDRLRAQQRIRTLEREKDMLESEVLSNMKKLEEDARASQKTMAESRHQHSRLVDQLEREKQKIKKDVERIEQIRMRRGNTPSTPRFTPAKLQSSETLYRFTLLLREANKISQHFKKDVTYSFEMVGQGDDGQTLIKVVNTKLNISTFWPRHKFEERLVHMRELFNSCEPEAYSADIDDVFCDVNDMWGKSDRGVSPKVLENLRKKPGTRSRLSFDSTSSVDSPQSVAMESPLVTAERKTTVGQEPADPTLLEMPTVSSLCRDLISSALHRFTDSALQESVADKILLHCEVIKGCIATTLEAFNNATEAGVQRSVFVESPAMRINSIQITSHLEVLLSQSALWVGSYESLTSSLIRDLCTRIMMTARKLGSQIILFLQGCENDLDTLVQESAGQALSSLFALSKQCGELALATETAMTCLTAPTTRGSTDSDEDIEVTTPIKVGDDVRQSFLAGCDVFIDKTLHGGLRTVEECELRIQTLTDDMSQSMPVDVEEVAQQVALTSACAKTMLMRCQQLQVDLDSTVQDTLMEAKPDAYYGRSYQRAQGLISHITNLTDTVTHFTQASTSYIRDSDVTALRKVARCAELIQKSAMKLLSTSNSDPASNTSSSFTDSVDVSLLSESCVEHLDVAAHEVKEATNSLITLVNRNLDREPSPPTPVRGKRVLPPSPVKGTGVTRRNSFSERTAQQKVHALRKAFENGS